VYGLSFAPAPDDAGGEVLVGCAGRTVDGGASGLTDKCVRIDTTSAAVTEIGTFSADGGGSFSCLGDLVTVGGRTFVNVIGETEDRIAELDLRTCELKSLRPLGVSGVSGLSYVNGR
jgi:hypothetical protein